MKGRRKIKRSRGQTSEKNIYFGPEHQEAIQNFNDAIDPSEKQKIYNEKILSAFNTLVENLIFVYGFAAGCDNVPELKSDCISFLYESLHKFDESRGTKAFSYFNVIARNWLIINSRRRNRFNSRHISLESFSTLSSNDKDAISHHFIAASPEDSLEKSRQKNDVRILLEKINLQLVEEHEKSCMTAIMTIFDQIDEIDIFHKRAIYIYVRDMSNLNSKQLSSAMSTIRKRYRELVRNDEGVF